MKKSRYNHLLGEFNNKHIYYNGLSKQTIEFNDEENKLYNDGKFNKIESLFPETFDRLKKCGYLYPENLDQKILIKQYLNSMEKNSHYLRVTFLLSRACNFDCVYCFQQNDISNEHLTMKTADKYIDYIKNQLENTGFKNVSISYYGGEPTINMEVLIYLHSKLIILFREKEIKFSFTMITNGYLLDQFIQQINPLEINTYVITLDGSKDIHNAKRKFKGGTGTFNKIIDNIKLLPDKSVSLNINLFNNDSINDVKKLLTLLDGNRLEMVIRDVHFKPIISTGTNCDYPGILSFSDMNYELILKCNEEGLKSGFGIKDYLNIGPCEYLYKHSYTFDVNGDIFRCPAMIEFPELKLGNIEDFQDYPENDNSYVLKNTECCDCEFLPNCYAGCRYGAYSKHKDLNKMNCEKEYFKDFGIEILKLPFKFQLKGGD